MPERPDQRMSERYPVVKFSKGLPQPGEDEAVVEEPLEIRVAGRGVGVTMRTPGQDEELVIGFLVGEGLISGPGDVEHVRPCDRATGDVVDVIVSAGVAVDFARLTRHVFASSSCGVCGRASIDAMRHRFPGAADGPRVPSRVLHGVAAKLRAVQPTFDQTGGLHAAGLFDASGELAVAREDVGRHNAVDKVVGWALMRGMLPLSAYFLVVSGRVSFEIVQKALAAGIPLIAGVSAPSSLAIDLCLESNMTLIGFLREGRFNVYAHPLRVRDDESRLA
jgi:FdhD protein